VVVVPVFGIFKYELQKEVAGGPIFFKQLRAPVIFAQFVRLSRLAVGSG
jgi:hypothetical protein